MNRTILPAVLCIGLTLVTSAVDATESCKELAQNTLELFEAGKISGSVAVLGQDATTACPSRNLGDDAADLCVFKALEPEKLPPNPGWDGVDFGYELEQLFTNPANYAVCADLFSQEPFASVVQMLPQPDKTVLEGLRQASRFRRSYGCELTDASSEPVVFDDTQAKIYQVFKSVQSWNFCAQRRSEAGHEVLGYFDSMQRVTMYAAVCQRDSLYGIDTSSLSPLHRASLVAAHEFGHALSCAAGLKERAVEEIATLLGSFLAQCQARLFKQLAQCYLDALPNAPPEQVAELDQKFLNCRFRGWRTMENALRRMRKDLTDQYSIEQAPSNARPSCASWAGPCLAYELD